jgi:hypothetical protein
MNLLENTKCTVIGPMQYSNGVSIRQYFKEELGKLNITVFDHYNKPFVDTGVDEGNGISDRLKNHLKNGEYDSLAAYRNIRSFDLNLIDRSDFIIFHFIPGVVTVGSWEEFFTANSIKKPIFFITEGGKILTPYWVFWTIPHHYIYNSKEEVMQILQNIDSGAREIDSNRWRLLRKEFR